MNQLINYGGVCRTAPATPGLLIIIFLFSFLLEGQPKTTSLAIIVFPLGVRNDIRVVLLVLSKPVYNQVWE